MAPTDVESRLDLTLTALCMIIEEFKRGVPRLLAAETQDSPAHVRLAQIQTEFVNMAKGVNILTKTDNEYRRLVVLLRGELDTLRNKSAHDSKVIQDLNTITTSLSNLSHLSHLPSQIQSMLTGGVQNAPPGAALGAAFQPIQPGSDLRSLIQQDMKTIIKTELLDDDNINKFATTFLKNPAIQDVFATITTGLTNLPDTFREVLQSSDILKDIQEKAVAGFADIHDIVADIWAELPQDFAAEFDLLEDYCAKIGTQVMHLASSDQVQRYYAATRNLQLQIGNATLDPFRRGGSVGKVLVSIKSDTASTKKTLTKDALEMILQEIDIVKSFTSFLGDLPDGAAVQNMFSVLADLHKENSVEKISSITNRMQPGGDVHKAITAAAGSSAEAQKQLGTLIGLPDAVKKLGEKEQTVKGMYALSNSVTSILNELRTLQTYIGTPSIVNANDSEMLESLQNDLEKKQSLLPLVEKLETSFASFLSPDSKFTFNVSEPSGRAEAERFAQSHLLKIPPAPFIYVAVSNFWDSSAYGTTTACWGQPELVEVFKALVERGYVCQSVSVGDDQDNAFESIRVSLALILRRYGVNPALIDLPKIVTGQAFHDRVESLVSELLATAPDPNHAVTAAKVTGARDAANCTFKVTKLQLDLILAEVSSIIRGQTNRHCRIATGTIVRSAAYGGHRLVAPKPPRGTRVITDILWIGNLGACVDDETSAEGRWTFGPRWLGFALPKSLTAPTSAVVDAHIRVKRRLGREFEYISQRSQANSPVTIDDYEEQLERGLLGRPGSRLTSAFGRPNPEMSETRFHKAPQSGRAPGVHVSSARILEDHTTGEPQPGTTQPNESTAAKLRHTFSMSNIKEKLGTGKQTAVERPEAVPEEEEHEAKEVAAADREILELVLETGREIKVTNLETEFFGNVFGVFIGGVDADIPPGIFTTHVLDLLTRQDVRDLSRRLNDLDDDPCCLATAANLLFNGGQNESAARISKVDFECIHCSSQNEPSQCVFYVGGQVALIKKLYLPTGAEKPAELICWDDRDHFTFPSVTPAAGADNGATTNQIQYAGQRPDSVPTPEVPLHFGSGTLVYVGPAPSNSNPQEFQDSSNTALAFDKRIRKGVKWVQQPELIRRQCILRNNKALDRCLATYATQSPAKTPGWDNKGPCNECQALKRECVVMVDAENAFVLGTGTMGRG